MRLLTEWINKQPLISFFIICYAISWGSWLPFLLSGNQILEILVIVGLFGPPLACIIVETNSTQKTTQHIQTPFWKSFLGSWILSIIARSAFTQMTTPEVPPIVYLIFGVLAMLPAYIIASAYYGAPNLRKTLGSLIHPPGWVGWYVFALLTPLLFRLLSVLVSNQLGWELLSDPRISSNIVELAGTVLVTFLYTVFYAGGLNEETGWTGLALPRLMEKFSPLLSTIIIWVLWMLWHVPVHFAGYFNLSLHVLVGSFLGRFLLTWLFMKSKGGLLTAILLHTSVNVTSQFVPLTNASLLIDAIVALIVIIEGKMWKRLPKMAYTTDVRLLAPCDQQSKLKPSTLLPY